MLTLASCAGAQRDHLDAADLPDDFALSVTVLPTKSEHVQMAPAWYTLGPDDVLHAALGERLPSSPAPPGVRTLSRDQVRHVWELVVQGGLASAQDPAVPSWQANSPGAAAIVYVAASGRRRTFAVATDRAEAVEPVVAELRRLGWVEGK
jgi:hypothetical protein